jgi:hypothetical protein
MSSIVPTAFVELARELDGALAGPDQQELLARRDVPVRPLEHDPPAEHQRDHAQRGQDEDAAPDDEVREPVIDAGQQQRRRAQRVDRPDEQLAAVGDDLQVVEVAVVQADLRDQRDQHPLEPVVLDEIERARPEPDIGRDHDRRADQAGLEDDERPGPQCQPPQEDLVHSWIAGAA